MDPSQDHTNQGTHKIYLKIEDFTAHNKEFANTKC